VATAVRERLDRVSGDRRGVDLVAEINSITSRCSALPLLDDRTPDEILGYDHNGEPLLYKGADFGRTDITAVI
jgi:antitoxin VapB